MEKQYKFLCVQCAVHAKEMYLNTEWMSSVLQVDDLEFQS